MIREKLLGQGVGEEFGFRWRGYEVTTLAVHGRFRGKQRKHMEADLRAT